MGADVQPSTLGELAVLVRSEHEHLRSELRDGIGRVERQLTGVVTIAVYEAHRQALEQRVADLELAARAEAEERREDVRARVMAALALLGVAVTLVLGLLELARR